LLQNRGKRSNEISKKMDFAPYPSPLLMRSSPLARRWFKSGQRSCRPCDGRSRRCARGVHSVHSWAYLGFRAAAERNTKHQTPSSREVPESKHQKPRSKHQRNPKFQEANRCPRFQLGTWSLELLRCLELGVWWLGPGASLELGVWNWELFAWALSFSRIEMRPALYPEPKLA
jgi:hypothetical protein